jgi:hypothetical protein
MKSPLGTTGIKSALLLATVCLSTAAVSQTIQNGSFETSTVSLYAYQYSNDEYGQWWYQSTQAALDAPNWTFSNMSGIIGAYGAAPWGNLAPEDGGWYAFIQSYSGGGLPGSISQTVTGLTNGQNYALSFYAAGRPSYSANTVTVGAAPTSPIASMAFTPTTGKWQYYTLDFKATGTSETFSWVGQPLPTNGQSMDNDTFVDNVKLTAVPGPAAALPFLLGFAGKARRRNKKA